MDPIENKSIGEGMDFLPESLKRSFDEGMGWVRDHPAEAMLAGVAGGLVLGLTGLGGAYRGFRGLRAMPILSEIVLGLVVKGLASRETEARPKAIH